MDDGDKFNEISLPENEDFYSHLNMEDIADVAYPHVKKVCKGFEIKTLEEYQDLYVRCKTLLLADVFENFRNICLEIYELDQAKTFFHIRINMTSTNKNDQIRIRSFN